MRGIYKTKEHFALVFCRAIDVQALVGNIGGYIGLFLGYCFLQIPDLLHRCFGLIKKWHLHLSSNDSQATLVREVIEAKGVENSNDTENPDNATR